MLTPDAGQRVRTPRLSPSEIMTILIHFHQSHYRTFKAYYTEYVLIHCRSEFPDLVSYNRFVELTPAVIAPLSAYLQQCQGNCPTWPRFPATFIRQALRRQEPAPYLIRIRGLHLPTAL